MIKEEDLLAAIAECQGVRNPNANTCIKLAAYYTILDHLQNNQQPEEMSPHLYSYDSSPDIQQDEIIKYTGKTEFSKLIEGRTAYDVWVVMDELMTTLQAINPRLYNLTIRKLKE